MLVVPFEYEPLDFGLMLFEPKAFVRLNSRLLDTRLAETDRARIEEFEGLIYSFQATDAGDENLRAVGLISTRECFDVAAAQGFVFHVCALERIQ